MSTIFAGTTVRSTCTFAPASAPTTPTNPTTVTVRVIDPAGTSVAGTAVNEGTGVYHADLELTAAGVHRIVWEGAGAVDVVQVIDVPVRAV